MPPSAATRFALIEQELKSINKKLDSFQKYIDQHEKQTGLLVDQMENHRVLAERRWSRQGLINKILGVVSGALVVGVITAAVMKVFG